jgi:hypothetical protein
MLRLHYDHHSDFDVGTLSLLLAAYSRLFGCDFILQSIGYGTYQVSFTIVAATKEEAVAIARHMNTSRRIATLTKDAVSVGVVVESLSQNDRIRSDLARLDALKTEASRVQPSEKGGKVGDTVREVEAIIEVAEADLDIGPTDEELSLRERLARMDDKALREPPAPESSYWRVGDAIGAVLGGLMKSLGAG